MKFTDGFWETRPGVDALYAQEAYDIEAGNGRLTVSAPTRVITRRGDTLNRAMLTVTLSSPLEGVVGVKVEHHRGASGFGGFDLVGAQTDTGSARADSAGGVLEAGSLHRTEELQAARLSPPLPGGGRWRGQLGLGSRQVHCSGASLWVLWVLWVLWGLWCGDGCARATHPPPGRCGRAGAGRA